MYVRGLLLSAGRKSMRNIAATADQPAFYDNPHRSPHPHRNVQQNLQQFVSKSTWDWTAVRQRLARILCHQLKATAWVLSPLVIPKAGSNTAGVDTVFVSHLGRRVSCQQALGIWFVRPEASCPMDWRLVLPASWTEDPFRRRRAAIPADVKNAPAWELGLDALITMINDWGLPMRPVIMDVREADAAVIIAELQRLQVAFIVRVDRMTRFVRTRHSDGRNDAHTGRHIGGHSGGCDDARRGAEEQYSADALAGVLKDRRQVVRWPDAERDAHQSVLAAAVRVGLPTTAEAAGARNGEAARAREGEAAGARDGGLAVAPVGLDVPPGRRELVLVAEWRDPVRGKPGFWVSNITGTSVPTLLRFADLTRRVHRDQEEISRRIGLYDFEGRSFSGWHRHVTLVSAAHAYITLNRLNPSFTGPRSPAGGEAVLKPAQAP
jgi:hypothetical protein